MDDDKIYKFRMSDQKTYTLDMDTKICAFDIETIARPLSDETINTFCKLGNLKDPKKIAIKQAETRAKLGANPLTAMACCGGWYASEEDKGYFSLENNSAEAEKEFLTKYWSQLAKYDLLVSYNGIAFDSRILLFRSAVRDVEIPFHLNRKRYNIKGNHLDLYQILTDCAPYGQGKLDFFLSMFDLGDKTPDIDGSMIQDYYNNGLHKDIGVYCVQDCKQTLKLFHKIKTYFL